MNRYLLDVNLVLALLDPRHIHSRAAHAWAAREPVGRWLTSPIVQNGVVRIAGHASYTSDIGPPSTVRDMLREFCDDPRHEFCPDDISLLDDEHVARPELLTPKGVSDTYLLALARHHGAQLATFDRRIVALTVRGGTEALDLIAP